MMAMNTASGTMVFNTSGILSAIRTHNSPAGVRPPAMSLRSSPKQFCLLKIQKEGDQPMVPKFSKDLNILAWAKSFDNFFDMTIR